MTLWDSVDVEFLLFVHQGWSATVHCLRKHLVILYGRVLQVELNYDKGYSVII